MNNWLNEFIENGICFSWHELKLGRFGYTSNNLVLNDVLDDCFVVQYTADYLSEHMEENNPYLWELGSLLKPYDKTEIFHLLHHAASSKQEDLRAYYKWRWIFINQFIRQLDKADFVNALLELSEFYLDLGSPSDMPFRHQATIEGMSLESYYTREHFNLVLSDHIAWLEKERLKLHDTSCPWDDRNERKSFSVVPLADIRSSKELHTRLAETLGFPDFYGKNWDAFWDVITGLVELPEMMVFKDWSCMEVQLPEEAEKLKRLLEEHNRQKNSLKAQVIFC